MHNSAELQFAKGVAPSSAVSKEKHHHLLPSLMLQDLTAAAVTHASTDVQGIVSPHARRAAAGTGKESKHP